MSRESRLIESRDKKLDKLLSLPEETKAYIIKGGYYYRPESCGYTEYRSEAGVYSIKEAVDSVRKSSLKCGMKVMPIDVEEHNKMLMDKIKEYKSRWIYCNRDSSENPEDCNV